MSVNGKAGRSLSRLCSGSRRASQARRVRFPLQHAMADDRSWKGKGQGRVIKKVISKGTGLVAALPTQKLEGRLFVAQTFHRIQLCGASCGHCAKQNSH